VRSFVRSRLAAAVALVALAVSGCAGAPEQEGAERAVERQAGTEAQCTGRSRIWFKEGPPAELMLCIVRREGGVCDRYRVDRRGESYRVTLTARNAHCQIPAG
jgi:hypothetical protein